MTPADIWSAVASSPTSDPRTLLEAADWLEANDACDPETLLGLRWAAKKGVRPKGFSGVIVWFEEDFEPSLYAKLSWYFANRTAKDFDDNRWHYAYWRLGKALTAKGD